MAVVFGLCLVVFVLWPLALQVGLGLPGDADFYLHEQKYQSIIAAVKALPLAPGGKTSTRIDGMQVDAQRNRTGLYRVTITTHDWDHAGIYGYVFSDVPVNSRPDFNYPTEQNLDNPGNLPFVGRRIVGQGGRWWPAYDNLE